MGLDGQQQGLETLGTVHAAETDWEHGAFSACTHRGRDHGRNAMIWLSTHRHNTQAARTGTTLRQRAQAAPRPHARHNAQAARTGTPHRQRAQAQRPGSAHRQRPGHASRYSAQAASTGSSQAACTGSAHRQRAQAAHRASAQAEPRPRAQAMHTSSARRQRTWVVH